MRISRIAGRVSLLLALVAAPSACDNPPATPPPVDGGARDTGMMDTDGGGDVDGGRDVDGGTPTARALQTNGSAIVLTSDDAIAVAVNRQAGSVAIFDVTTGAAPALTRRALLELGDAEPWMAVIGNDDDSAFVITRRGQEVLRIRGLRGTPAIDSVRGRTGSEPTGLAISPTGRRLYVANWAEGTVSVIDTANLMTVGSVDLNASLVATGVLGTIAARPALAHPRAIVVTNDGDGEDDDETVYVTEFFGQSRTDALPADLSRFDVAKQGLVYRFNAGTRDPDAPIRIAPVTDTGFPDSAGNVTGCYPNQLATATITDGMLFVAAVCASPRGPTGPVTDMAGVVNPANFRTEVHTTVFGIDVATNAEVTDARVLLPRAFTDRYTAMSTPDDASRRLPLILTDLAFVPGTRIGYATSYGSDAVFRIVWGADDRVAEVGSAVNSFIDLAPSGRLPMGIAIARGTTPQAVVVNETTRSVSFLAFGTQTAVLSSESSPLPAAGSPEAHRIDGRRFFVTGLGRWSLRGQAWNSCETCHGDGLTDNVTWFFARGPRQSTSLDGSYDSDDPTERRIFNWTAIFDETHDFELNTRGNSGGLGAIVHAVSMPPGAADRIVFDGTTPAAGQMPTATPQAGLSGSTASMMPGGSNPVRSVLADWDHIEEYIASIRSPRAPTTLAAADVAAGRTLFESHNCAGCHGTSMWTISRVFYAPGEINNHPVTGQLRVITYDAPAGFPRVLNPPVMAGPATLRFPAGMAAGGNDTIQCALRSVGTFPAMGTDGVAEPGVVLSELRADMSTPAQGAIGFNPPSLLGLSVGAPYYHGGNARTLEAAFDARFQAHHTGFSVNFLVGLPAAERDTQVRQMTAYLLSIDEDTAPVAVPTTLGFNPVLCPSSL